MKEVTVYNTFVFEVTKVFEKESIEVVGKKIPTAVGI